MRFEKRCLLFGKGEIIAVLLTMQAYFSKRSVFDRASAMLDLKSREALGERKRAL